MTTDVIVECNRIHQTAAAVLIQQDNRQCWIPKSLISYSKFDPQVEPNFTIKIPPFIAKRENLDYD